jgi:hypothetical protein
MSNDRENLCKNIFIFKMRYHSDKCAEELRNTNKKWDSLVSRNRLELGTYRILQTHLVRGFANLRFTFSWKNFCGNFVLGCLDPSLIPRPACVDARSNKQHVACVDDRGNKHHVACVDDRGNKEHVACVDDRGNKQHVACVDARSNKQHVSSAHLPQPVASWISQH